jgi:hypothetical protein
MLRKIGSKFPEIFTVVIALLAMVSAVAAQEKIAPEEFQAQAMGTSTQMGQSFNVTIHIDEYSSMENRQVLVDAFNKAGSQGLFNALQKMHSVGHIAITGTLGYDISFARKIPNPDGTYTLRILTSRPITFGEAWTDSRSMDYNLSALTLTISPEKGKSTGQLVPACQFVIDKKTNEIQLSAYQNPWTLVDVLNRSPKPKD